MSTSDSSAATFRASLRSLRFRPLALPSAPVAPLRPASAAEHQTSAHHPVRTPAVFAPAAARPTAFAPLARRPEPGQTAGHRGTHALTSRVRTFFTAIKLADVCMLTTDVAEGSYIGEALSLVGKRGRVVVTAIGHPEETSISGSLLELTLYEKQIRGALYGSSNAAHDIPRLVELYNSGQLKLDELITREYTLDQINEGYADMRSGRNIRGLIRF